MQNQDIFKGTCVSCRQTFYTKNKFTCQQCSKELKSKLIFKNPIESVKPKSIIITTSFKSLNPQSYSQSDILHVGISNSKRNVFNFWNSYKIEDPQVAPLWFNCINIKLENLELEDDSDFDSLLQFSLEQQRSDPEHNKYNQINNNCFDFVCRFLNEIQYQAKNNWSKQALTEVFIKQPITILEKYCFVYQQLSNRCGIVAINQKDVDSIFPLLNYSNAFASCDVCDNHCSEKSRFKCLICEDYDLCQLCFQINQQNSNKFHSHPFQQM